MQCVFKEEQLALIFSAGLPLSRFSTFVSLPFDRPPADYVQLCPSLSWVVLSNQLFAPILSYGRPIRHNGHLASYDLLTTPEALRLVSCLYEESEFVTAAPHPFTGRAVARYRVSWRHFICGRDTRLVSALLLEMLMC
jgi:hypothetical protein